LFYQIALKGREELPWAVDPRSGLEMTLLRMFAFAPAAVPALPEQDLPSQSVAPAAHAPADAEQKKKPLSEPSPQELPPLESYAAAPPVPALESIPSPPWPVEEYAQTAYQPAPTPSAVEQPNIEPSAPSAQANQQSARTGSAMLREALAKEPVQAVDSPTFIPQAPSAQASAESTATRSAMLREAFTSAPLPPVTNSEPVPVEPAVQSIAVVQSSEEGVERIALADLRPRLWSTLFRQLTLSGVTRSMASNSILQQVSGNRLLLMLDENQATLFNDDHRARIQQALSNYFSVPVELQMDPGLVTVETPSQERQRLEREYYEKAKEKFRADPLVQEFLRQFAAEIQPGSISPLQPFQWQ